MKKLIFVTIILLLSIFLVLKSEKGGGTLFQTQLPSDQATVSINGHRFKAVVAKTDQDKQTGLTKYQSLSDDQAMVFPFDKEVLYPFWMKGMKFSIDMIFIDKGKVVDIKKKLPPADPSQAAAPMYAPSQNYDEVLEILAGLSDKYGFKIGDSVQTSGF